jgi:hypothetical protein
MADISIQSTAGGTYRVTVTGGGSTTTHEVSVGSNELELLPEGKSTEDLVEASVRFLLDREPKEAIMSSFDLSVIRRYFPEYRDRIGDYL